MITFFCKTSFPLLCVQRQTELFSLHLVLYAAMFCAFPNCPFSLLSQVFSFSSALLTAHELFGVSHRCIFFCHPPLSAPKKKKKVALRKHLKRPRIHQPYLSLHTSSSFFFPELLCHTLSVFFLADVTFVKLKKKTF